MTQNNIGRSLPQKPKFEWNKINSQFRFKQGSKYTKIPLRPSLKINQKEGSQTKIQTKIHIDTEKSLQYENQIGWNWHKSSNLPIISIKLQIRDVQKDTLLLPPANLQAKIYAAKFVVNSFEKDQVAYLEDVGIRGPNNIQLRQGCGFFNGVRFSSTSYNNEGVKFYLVIVVYLKDQDSDIQSNIICSLLSPPIFVDSRKSARDYQEKRFLSFVELFDPTEFSKLFKKRETRNNINDLQTQISNNFDGLYNYITAPNIRHKVKHPLFWSVKFSNVFKIFYNKNHESFQQKKVIMTEVIKKLQKKLVKEVGGQKKLKKNDDVNKKLFIISMVTNCNQTKKAKVMNALQYLDCKSIFIAEFEYMITDSFANIDTIGDVIDAYAQIYPVLQILSQKQISARKTRQIQYQRSQKYGPNSPKQQIQDEKYLVKKQHLEQNNFGTYRSQKYYPNRSKNENDSEQDNFSDDGSYQKNKYRFKSREDHQQQQNQHQQQQMNTYNQKELAQKRQTNYINNRIDNSLLKANLIHPDNHLSNGINIMNQIQDMGLHPILQNPIIKQDVNSGLNIFGQSMPNLSNLTQSNFANSMNMMNSNNPLQNNFYEYEINRIQSNQNRHFMLKNLLDQVVSKSGMLNKMLYENEMLKNKILLEINQNNHIFHQMNYMAALNENNKSSNPYNPLLQDAKNQDFQDDKSNSVIAGFKQISSPPPNRQLLQRHFSHQHAIQSNFDRPIENQNVITVRNSGSSSNQLHQNQNNSSSNAQKDMEEMECKFQQNVFQFSE